MSDFTVRTGDQLPILLKALRKQAGLTQAGAAMRLGITQQAFSTLERNAASASAGRLLELLSILNVELVLRQVEKGSREPSQKAANPAKAMW